MERLSNISNQISPNILSSSPLQRSANDVVICAAVRTPLTQSGKGLLKDTAPEIMLKHVFEALIKRSKIDPKKVEDIVCGNSLQPGSGVFPCRMAAFLADFPDTTCVVSINRLCSSGLEACATVAAKITAGIIDIGIGAGVENMSTYDIKKYYDAEKLSASVFEHEKTKNCLLSMGMTSENVAEKFGISRETQDKFAVVSHAKAAKAQESGLFNEEIIPVTTTVKDKDGNDKQVTVSNDDSVRKETTYEGLQKLKSPFKKDGSTTAGNSSQVTDGAAGVLFAKRSVAENLGLPIIGKFVAYAVAGVPPEIMGIGPAFAIPAVLKKAGMTINDIDIFEINEAFASQASYCINKLGIDFKKVNPKGGAIAFGPPLGCNGVKLIATMMPELKRQSKKYGLITMCVGGGMGAAAIIENEQ